MTATDQARAVRHYAASSMGDALCGAEWPDGKVAAWKADTTCPRCLAQLADDAERAEQDVIHFAHGMTRAGSQRPECGAAGVSFPGSISLLATSVTCPRCLALLAGERRVGAPVRVPLPGSGFMVTYESQGERDRTLRLAEARQQLAHEGNGNPTWQELTDDERGTSELSARNWLRAAERAGLLAEQGQTDDDTEAERALDAYIAGDPEA